MSTFIHMYGENPKEKSGISGILRSIKTITIMNVLIHLNKKMRGVCVPFIDLGYFAGGK